MMVVAIFTVWILVVLSAPFSYKLQRTFGVMQPAGANRGNAFVFGRCVMISVISVDRLSKKLALVNLWRKRPPVN
jgi:hypothetical protein